MNHKPTEMHIHYIPLPCARSGFAFQRRLDMLPEYMPSESRKWCWMAYTYSKNIRSNTHNHIIKSLFAMDMDIDLESSPSTAAPSCCSRCKQQCFQDTTSIALTASHHFFDHFQQQPLHTIAYHYIPLHTIAYHYIPLHTIAYHYIPLHTITYHYIPLLCGHIDLFFVDIGGKLWKKVHPDHPWPSVTLRRGRSYASFGLNRRNSCWNSRNLCPSMATWDVRRFLWWKSVRFSLCFLHWSFGQC